MDKYFGSICLTDIPRELMREGNNGKLYLSVVVAERRTPSKYGFTHYIKAYAKRGEVDDNVNLYIGELKPSKYNDDNQQQDSTAAPTTTDAKDDRLPF